jgi:hypothetical protein
VPRPLYVHIGLQKTGTSYLQHVFWASAAALTGQGLDMVPPTKRDTFHLMLDVRDRYRPGSDPARVAHALDRLEGQLERATGTRALITEESLASCTEDQVARLLASCGDREVHVIATVRDLARQIPSAWQQSVQMGNERGLSYFTERMRRTDGSGHWMWKQRDVPAALARWAEHVPAARIHVVTVPPKGADRGLLLERFCSVLDVDPATLDTRGTGRDNRSLGYEQAEVLRRVNHVLPDEVKGRRTYGEHGKRYLAVQVLGGEPGSPILLPPRYRDWCFDVSRRHIEQLDAAGYDVVGDLEDLVPSPASFSSGPSRPKNRAITDAAVQAVASMLTDRIEADRQEHPVQPGHDASPGPTGASLRALARPVLSRLRRQ